MSSDKSAELCRILKTGNPTTKISLPDDLKKLSEAELLEFLNKNEKEIIDGVIDTFSKCGIKITANDNKVIIESPGHYTVTYNVKTMKMTKTHPIGFGSSKPRFTGGTNTKKNRKSIKHLKKSIRGMVRKGGERFVDPASFLLNSVIELICYSVIGVVAVGAAGIAIGAAGIAIGLSPIVWACKKIYERFNGNPTTVVATNTDYDNDNATVMSEESNNENGDGQESGSGDGDGRESNNENGDGQESNNALAAPTDQNKAYMEANREMILDKMRKEREDKLRSMTVEEREEEEEKKQKRLAELMNRKSSPFNAFNNKTPGGKNSRSKTRKQKRRKTKK